MGKLNVSEYIGKTINNLTILYEVPFYTKSKSRSVMASCICGITKKYVLHKILSGHTKSCGCDKGKRGANLTTHGLSKHPLYRIWAGIKIRCYDIKSPNYMFYGARGVRMCEEWINDFNSFYNWAITNGWQANLEIDKDIKGDGKLYSPEYCCFVTPKVNNNNRFDNKILMVDGKELTMSEAAEKYQISYFALRSRLRRGWQDDKAVKTKVRKMRTNKMAEIRHTFGFIN